MAEADVLERIRALERRPGGLFRVHHTHAGLYARARRQFGSWSAALGAAGIDYRIVVDRARALAVAARRRRRRRDRAQAFRQHC
jgi:hypothetical protein